MTPDEAAKKECRIGGPVVLLPDGSVTGFMRAIWPTCSGPACGHWRLQIRSATDGVCGFATAKPD